MGRRQTGDKNKIFLLQGEQGKALLEEVQFFAHVYKAKQEPGENRGNLRKEQNTKKFYPKFNSPDKYLTCHNCMG